jgi:hypothetical protein
MVKGNILWDARIWGTQEQAREIAIGAVRSYMRSMSIEPSSQTSDQAYASLNDLAMQDGGTVAGHFSRFASINQLDLFVKDWNRWQKNQL